MASKHKGVYTYFHVYIHLRFKHAVSGTHLNCMGCLSTTLSFVSLLDVNEFEKRVSCLIPTHWPFKNLLCVGVCTKMRTEYIPAYWQIT